MPAPIIRRDHAISMPGRAIEDFDLPDPADWQFEVQALRGRDPDEAEFAPLREEWQRRRRANADSYRWRAH